MKKIILHLCADLGSDSYYYQQNKEEYEVIMVGEKIGVQNYHPPANVHGIIANPVCTEFSIARSGGKARLGEEGMFLVDHCIRIIKEANPIWWVIENPSTGRLKDYLGKPIFCYQPWQFGSPWTKKTALWGKFNLPKIIYDKWDDVPKIEGLYVRSPLAKHKRSDKPGLYQFHKSAVDLIPEMQWAKDHIKCDADIRSMCSRGFAERFYLSNR